MSRKFARICNVSPGIAAARRNMVATRDCLHGPAIVGTSGSALGSPSQLIDFGTKAGTLEEVESPFGAWVTVQPATQ
jgi:hypothetical protein